MDSADAWWRLEWSLGLPPIDRMNERSSSFLRADQWRFPLLIVRYVDFVDESGVLFDKPFALDLVALVDRICLRLRISKLRYVRCGEEVPDLRRVIHVVHIIIFTVLIGEAGVFWGLRVLLVFLRCLHDARALEEKISIRLIHLFICRFRLLVISWLLWDDRVLFQLACNPQLCLMVFLELSRLIYLNPISILYLGGAAADISVDFL